MSSPAPRSAAAVALLERLQQPTRIGNREERRPEDDPRVLREIAERQLMAESGAETAEALVAFVSRPSYEAEVDARAKALADFFAESDGDIWSRFERPDRRRRLATLVTRVEAGAAKRGLEIPRRPVVGTLPTFLLNASAIPGPPGEGHIVAFDSGIFTFTEALAKVATQAIDIRVSDDGASLRFDPHAMHRHPERYLGVVRQFADLLFSQAVLGTSSYAEIVTIAPEYGPVADQLIEAVETFALAHEYGHVILGHTAVHASGGAAREQELAADGAGFEIADAAWNGPLWAYLGASVFFSGYDAVDRAANTFLNGTPEAAPSATHPPGAERRRAVAQRMPPGSPALTMGDAIDDALATLGRFFQPAFLNAYREGYPPSGYRPSSEIEKAAAFEAFFAGGMRQE